MNVLEITLASSQTVSEQVPKRLATIKRLPGEDYIKVVFVDAISVRDHYVLADCLEDAQSMAELLGDQLGGKSDEYLGILKYFMD